MDNQSGLSPMEYNVVIELDPPKKTTIIIPDEALKREDLSTEEGTLVAASPAAFTYHDSIAAPEIGSRVLFARYAGSIHERNGRKFRILKDQSVIAVVEPPALAAAA